MNSAGASSENAYSTDVIGAGALVYYPLDDRDGTLRDASGHGQDGAYGSKVGRCGPALTSSETSTSAFDGGVFQPERLVVAPAVSLAGAKAVTIEAWVRWTSTDLVHRYIPIVSLGRLSSGPAYALMISPQDVLQFYVRTARGGFNLEGTSVIAPGAAHQIAATYDGETAAVYVDGTLDASIAATGAIDYRYIGTRDELGIGGSIDRGSPIFEGDVGHVAIYGSALSSTVVTQHYIAGVHPQQLREKARSDASFVDSIGINTHLHYTGTRYDTRWTDVKRLLHGLGLRHIRDGLVDVASPTYYRRLEELGRIGIKSTLVTSSDETAALIADYPRRVPTAFEAYEGPNEMDVRRIPNWIPKTRAFQKMLYATVKGDARIAHYRVLGPSLSAFGPYAALGDLSASMDVGNFHEYFPGFNPGNDGFGSHTSLGNVGSIDFNVNAERIVAGPRPLQATESGFNFAPNVKGNIPLDVAAKYVPRTYLEMFNRGVTRTFLYQLLDFENEPGFELGIVSQDMVPKAPYYAIASLISLLNDAHPSQRTDTLDYTLSGNLSDVHHTLFERGDGSIDLALWVETRSITPTIAIPNGTRIVVSPRNVTAHLPFAAVASARAIDGSGRIVDVPTQTVGPSVRLDVTDAVTIVHLARR